MADAGVIRFSSRGVCRRFSLQCLSVDTCHIGDLSVEVSNVGAGTAHGPLQLRQGWTC
jgi:hypothetical protein